MSSLLRQLQVGSEASTVPELLAVERNRVQINTLMWVVGQEGSLKPGLTTRGTSSAPQKHSSKSARPMEAKPCCAFDDGHVHQLRRSGKNWLYMHVSVQQRFWRAEWPHQHARARPGPLSL